MRVSPRIALFLACVCLQAHHSAAQSRSDEFAGYVFKINGSWRVAPQYPADLAPGYGLLDTARISRRSAGSDDYIFIGKLDGSVISRECKGTADACADIVVGPAAPERSLSNSFRELWKILHPPPLPPEIVASRGTTDHELREAVLLANPSRTDAAPAIADVHLGIWDAEFRPLGNGGEPIHAILQWLPPKATLDKVIPPGLYALTLAEDNTGTSAGPRAGTNTAVVLVTQDKADAELFRQALHWTDLHKGSSLPADGQQYFLRSVVYAIGARHSRGK